MGRSQREAVGEARTCASCGRVMTWRRSWARDWDNVRWCSQRCRRRGVTAVDDALSSAILALLDTRRGDASICPSEAARAVAGDDPEAWRPLMEPARAAARRLVAAGEVEVTQRGRVVDPSVARGPIRVRRVRRPG
jgi:hypothetical protein